MILQERLEQAFSQLGWTRIPEILHRVAEEASKKNISYVEDEAAHFFFQIVSERYEKGSILLTSNKSYGSWGEIFEDSVLATAILDRLLHHSSTINIKGESYRIKEKKKAGFFKLDKQNEQGE